MKNNFFSIIVPVYNAEKHLQRCIDSIRFQTYDKFEIIMVNDGSTDNSDKIIKNNIMADDRIKYYYQENKGPLSARSNGIKISKGEFCIFVDADDFLETRALEIINDNINNLQCDLLIYGWNLSIDRENKEPYIFRNKRDLYQHVFLKPNYNNLWRKAIKTTLLNDVDLEEFNYLTYSEDLLMSINPYIKATKVAEINDKLYNYRDNRESIMHSRGYKNFDYDFTVKNLVLNILEEEDSISQNDIIDYYQISMEEICGITYRMARNSSYNEFKRQAKKINDSTFKKKCEGSKVRTLKYKITSILLNSKLYLSLWALSRLYNFKNPIVSRHYG